MDLYFLSRRVSVVPSAYYHGHRCIYPRPPVVATVRASLRESCPCGLPERKHCYRPSRHRNGNVAALYRVPRILRLRLSACISRGGCSKLSYPTEITASKVIGRLMIQHAKTTGGASKNAGIPTDIFLGAVKSAELFNSTCIHFASLSSGVCIAARRTIRSFSCTRYFSARSSLIHSTSAISPSRAIVASQSVNARK